MAEAKIHSGICGFDTVVRTQRVGKRCQVAIQSDCKSLQKLAENLIEVDPFQEISYSNGGPLTFQMAAQCRLHPACPVPAGIIKAVEVECKLAVPANASIELTR
jgi:hypothetical protein